jgi:type I restriction enzyme R subunit
MQEAPSMKEDHISQVPALQLLQNLGYTYLTPEETLAYRSSKTRNVILDDILAGQLRKMNVVKYKGREYPFTEGNIFSAIQSLKDVVYDGLIRTNEKVYDLLCLGRSLQQSIEGDIKSFTLKYIDWEIPENNVYHITEEFSVERSGTKEEYRPDIVLFVNGIPLVVIECKKLDLGPGKEPIEQAISQHIRNQKDNGIPQLFLFSQLLLAVSKNAAKYATTGTSKNFWAIWRDEKDTDKEISKLINKSLSSEKKEKLFQSRFKYVRSYFEELEKEDREVTEQDRALYSLCRPERLLELAYRYILYDAGEKKIARYQQFFCVKNITKRIKKFDSDGRRIGGVVWHTQGSGKSLTMVILAKAIALEPSVENYKIILVTDRVDLDDQIYKTFHHCGKEVEQAKTGKHLMEMIEGHKERIITTVIDKFDAAIGIKDFCNPNPNIFVLVDEGHRGQYGTRHAKMRKTMPNACYIAFTGTPIMKKDKNTVIKFGGLIEPSYTISQAVKDKAVVPLLYEGRHVAQKVDSESIDSWFDKITKDLTKEQSADLKKKFTTTDQLNKAEQKVMRIAWDISEHFKKNWQGKTPFKGQLVTQDKPTALLYKKYLDEFNMVSSEVLISSPDDREGEEDIYSENKEVVNRFWETVKAKYKTEKEYNKQVINAFKNGEIPEIIIVVDKLITGFDAPRNTILYLTRMLKDHSLLQAIARVNRLYEGKDFGYIIDYRGVLENLDHALDLYAALPDFNKDDLADTLTDISSEVQTLPQKHSVLWDIFKEISNKYDEEAYERLLADDALRTRFYERFSEYGRTLAIALSSVSFIENTEQKKIDQFKKDLIFFRDLRNAVKKRYAEVVDFSEYEPKIKKLIDTYVGTSEKVEQIIEPVNIFDQEKFGEEVDKLKSDAAKADTIAHRTMKYITDHMQEDPAYYKKLSVLLQEAIKAFRDGRIQEAEYFKTSNNVMNRVINRTGDNIPETVKYNETAVAYYGIVRETVAKYGKEQDTTVDAAGKISLVIDEIIKRLRIVNWGTNADIQNQMRNKIEDMIFEVMREYDITLTFDEIDAIMDQCIDVAKVRIP